MKVVADNDPHQIAVAQAREDFEHELRKFTANLLRILAGAGSPYELFQQMHATMEAWAALIRLDPNAARQAEFDILVNALYLDINKFTEENRDRWLADGTIAQMRGERHLMRAALRYVASEMVGDNSQRSRADSAIYDAIRDIEAANERYKARWK